MTNQELQILTDVFSLCCSDETDRGSGAAAATRDSVQQGGRSQSLPSLFVKEKCQASANTTTTFRKYIGGTCSVIKLLRFSPQPGQQRAAPSPNSCCYWLWPTATCSQGTLTLSCAWRCSGSQPPSWDFLHCTSR